MCKNCPYYGKDAGPCLSCDTYDEVNDRCELDTDSAR